MDRHFFDELNSLKQELLNMGSLVEEMVSIAVRALVEHDVNLLETIRQNEARVNRLQVDIDEYCLKLIALHQPAASDLRFLLGISKINAELERVGDHTVNICKGISVVLEKEQVKPFIDMPKMVEIVSSMFKESLHAFVILDVDKARMILLRDDQVDQLRYKIIQELIELMKKEPEKVETAVSLILTANSFEKIADHATNIAEVVIFVAQGKDVRHHFEDPLL
ncbi:MAG: phosphate transport system regulatory protein PhoU [Spirochaetes bacterium RBG_16_49_21]|nr:MAG: phosphate transport system regulatory protein PhoU [Spirochaetes bacterium RBG_16_49_21]